MTRIGLLAVCLLLALCQYAPAYDLDFSRQGFQPPGKADTRGFQIPSKTDISSDEGMYKYREQYRPKQYFPESDVWIWVDMGMLAGILCAGGIMVWRRAHYGRFRIPALVTLLYFGFLRGGCICPVGSVANMAIGLNNPELIGISTAVMFLMPLVVAFIMGRVFCVAGCPIGAIQHLLARKRPLKIPRIPHIILRTLPVVALVATAWLAVRGACLLVCILDPYKSAFFFGYGWIQRIIHLAHGGLVEPGVLRVGDLTAWGIFAFAVMLGLWVYSPFCRFVCPYGV
jgi:hypothetical protein